MLSISKMKGSNKKYKMTSDAASKLEFDIQKYQDEHHQIPNEP